MSENHIVPVKYYVVTFSVLVFLTGLTVYTAKYVDLGSFNFALAMLIALIKASFVVLFFMGLRWDKGVNAAILLSSLIFVFIFLTITLIDSSSRGLIIEVEGKKIDLATPVKIESK